MVAVSEQRSDESERVFMRWFVPLGTVKVINSFAPLPFFPDAARGTSSAWPWQTMQIHSVSRGWKRSTELLLYLPVVGEESLLFSKSADIHPGHPFIHPVWWCPVPLSIQFIAIPFSIIIMPSSMSVPSIQFLMEFRPNDSCTGDTLLLAGPSMALNNRDHPPLSIGDCQGNAKRNKWILGTPVTDFHFMHMRNLRLHPSIRDPWMRFFVFEWLALINCRN